MAKPALLGPDGGIYTPEGVKIGSPSEYRQGIAQGLYTAHSGRPSAMQDIVDAQYKSAAAKNPAISALSQGGSSVDDIVNALQTGDLSSIYTASGQPFSASDQQAALDQANKDQEAYYKAMETKDTADTERAMEQAKADYQDYLINAGEQFVQDKADLDQAAADKGVLFSGGRIQKEKRLEGQYSRDQATKMRNTANTIADNAGTYQYKYGNSAANNLGKYYSLGGNSYNANASQGNVTTGGLSTIYDPNKYTMPGTIVADKATAANKRAAGLLWNKGNKLLSTGYNNKY